MLVNGSPTLEFKLRRGLRQGDPLTSFLFLIVADGLAGVTRKAMEKDLLESVTVGEKLVKVNMLQYANDTLLFCEANPQSMFVIKVMLNYFELTSGLKVNYLKSSIGGWGAVSSCYRAWQLS